LNTVMAQISKSADKTDECSLPYICFTVGERV
jgi:hypothetical protein